MGLLVRRRLEIEVAVGAAIGVAVFVGTVLRDDSQRPLMEMVFLLPLTAIAGAVGFAGAGVLFRLVSGATRGLGKRKQSSDD